MKLDHDLNQDQGPEIASQILENCSSHLQFEPVGKDQVGLALDGIEEPKR